MINNERSAKKCALIAAIVVGTAAVAGAVGTIVSKIKKDKSA